VGCNIAANYAQNNPYARWIETYSSEEFSHSTNEAIGLLDKIAEESFSEVLDMNLGFIKPQSPQRTQRGWFIPSLLIAPVFSGRVRKNCVNATMLEEIIN